MGKIHPLIYFVKEETEMMGETVTAIIGWEELVEETGTGLNMREEMGEENISNDPLPNIHSSVPTSLKKKKRNVPNEGKKGWDCTCCERKIKLPVPPVPNNLLPPDVDEGDLQEDLLSPRAVWPDLQPSATSARSKKPM